MRYSSWNKDDSEENTDKNMTVSSLASDFIRQLLVVFLIFLSFLDAKWDDNLYGQSEEEGS